MAALTLTVPDGTMNTFTFDDPTLTGDVIAKTADSFSVGPNGKTNPAFAVDPSVASAATGIKVTGRAAAAGVDVDVQSSGSNESVRLNALGTGTLTVQGAATGNFIVGAAGKGQLALANQASLAAAGSNQGGAAAIVNQVTVVTGSDDAKGVVLPAPAAGGAPRFVYNSVTNKTVEIYPPSGGTINGGTTNVSVTLPAATLAVFFPTSATNWAGGGVTNLS